MYGLRFRSVAQSLGSVFDWFVPDYDMPDYPTERGYAEFRDVLTTPSGNTFIYDKSRIKKWNLIFSDITELSVRNLQHLANGWLGKKQITMVYFGTNVTGTTQSVGTYSAGQLWGTGFLLMQGLPKEKDVNLWDVTIELTEFGTGQIFT